MNGYGLAPYFMALALWVGAIGFYLMTSALNAKALADRRSVRFIAARSFLPGAVMAITQAVLMVSFVRFGLNIEPANLLGLYGAALLTSLTFMTVNLALVALLDAPGRFIALLLIVVQLSAAGGTYPIETAPAFFRAVHGLLPLTYSVESFRSLIAGGSVGISDGIVVHLIWLAAAIATFIVAVARQRRKAMSPVASQSLPSL